MGIGSVESIFEKARRKGKNQSPCMADWAVDCDYQNDTFTQGWVDLHTRKELKPILLTPDVHKYDKPGKYRILVKVIDIFGNDTSQAFDVEVPLS